MLKLRRIIGYNRLYLSGFVKNRTANLILQFDNWIALNIPDLHFFQEFLLKCPPDAFHNSAPYFKIDW